MYEIKRRTNLQPERTKTKQIIKWTESEAGRGYGIEGRASVGRGLRAERRQRGGKHQHFRLHEGKVGQTCNHFGCLLAQVLLLPGLPVKQEVRDGCKHVTRNPAEEINDDDPSHIY